MFLYGGSEISQIFTPLYSSWVCILILQCLSFTWFTGRSRVQHGVIHSEEDRMWLENRETKITSNANCHPEVAHLRSGHWRNLEVIIPYLFITPIWLNTNPSYFVAKTILHSFPAFKIIDTLFYMNLIKAPMFFERFTLSACYAILIYLTVSTLIFSM